jgi:hypothetical protein
VALSALELDQLSGYAGKIGPSGLWLVQSMHGQTAMTSAAKQPEQAYYGVETF